MWPPHGSEFSSSSSRWPHPRQSSSPRLVKRCRRVAKTLPEKRYAAGNSQTQTADLERQESDLQAQEAKLADAAQRLQVKVETFRTRKETIKATYTAAEAQTKISESVSGISEEMGDVGLAMQRAQDKTEQMQARAGALDELLSSGALDDATQTSDPIQAQLDALGTGSGGVDARIEEAQGGVGAGRPGSRGSQRGPQHCRRRTR